MADRLLMAFWMVAADLPCFDVPWQPEQYWLYIAQVCAGGVGVGVGVGGTGVGVGGTGVGVGGTGVGFGGTGVGFGAGVTL